MIFIFIVLNSFVTLGFKKIKLFKYLIDKPDGKRKIHLKPTPLAGGIILITNIFILFIIINFNPDYLTKDVFFKDKSELYVFFISAFTIFLLGLVDDKYNLSANLKILILSIIIIFALYFDNSLIISNIKISFIDNAIGTKNLGLLFSLFCILVFLNAFNMFDGINLQASSYSLTIFLFLSFTVINSLLIKIIIVFLIFYSLLNYKNETFLGDNGSLLLAFLISYIFIKFYNLELIKFADEIFIYMMLPGIDLIRLFFKRAINKRNPLKPDKDHLHHLLISKFSLKKSLLILNLMIIVPIFLNYLNINKLVIILSLILVYTIVIKKLKS